MTFEKFAASVGAAVPNHKPDALSIWQQFAVELVESEQFVHFEAMEDKTAAAEKWLDVICNGILAVKDSFGVETAAALVNLSCEKCCLYPGEMMQAAVCLNEGCNGEDIFSLINSGDIDTTDLFSPMSRKGAMGVAEAAKSVKRHGSILEYLNRTEKTASFPKHKSNKERGTER